MKLTWCLLIGIMFTSCHDEYSICEQPTEVRLRSGFYSAPGGSEQVISVPSFTFGVLGSSTPIYNQQPDVSKFLCSLNPTVPTIQFTLTIQPNITDTITLAYTTQKVSISEICPDIYIHNLNAVSTTTHYADSVKISAAQVNTTISEHLKVYL